MHINELFEARYASEYKANKMQSADDEHSAEFAKKLQSRSHKRIHDRSTDYFKSKYGLDDSQADAVHRLHIAVMKKSDRAEPVFSKMLDELSKQSGDDSKSEKSAIIRTYQRKIRDVA